MSDIRELLHDAAEHPGELDLERVRRDGRRRQLRPLKIAGAVVAVLVVAVVATVRIAADDQHTAPVIAPPPTGAPLQTTALPAPTTPPSTTATATPTPRIPVEAGPLDSFRLGYDGLGPIKLGMTFDEASEASGVEIATEQYEHGCGTRSDEATGHVSGYEGAGSLWIVRRDGKIVSISTTNPNLVTISGIHSGSTLREVLRTYSNAQIGHGTQGNTAVRITNNAGHQVVFYFATYDDNPDAVIGVISVDENRSAEIFRESLC